MARQGKNEPFPFVGYCACYGGATSCCCPHRCALPIAHCRCTSNCACRGPPTLALQTVKSSLRRPARLLRTRRATFSSLRKSHDLTGATVAIDSDGGSVLGAIALGTRSSKSQACYYGRPHRRSSGTKDTASRARSCRRLPTVSRCAPSCYSAACNVLCRQMRA